MILSFDLGIRTSDFKYIEELNMAEGAKDTGKNAPADPGKGAQNDTPASSAELLEARVTELENVVHQLTLHTLSTSDHPGVVAWLKRVGARIEAAVEKVV